MNSVERVVYGSPAYQATVELRRAVLRRPLGLDFTPDQLASEADDVHLAILEGERAIACLILSPVDGSTLKMRQVAVDGARQGEGIGRRLVEAAESWAQAHAYRVIVLHAREVALPFYVRLNYEVEGEPFEEVGIPHRAMSKRLS